MTDMKRTAERAILWDLHRLPDFNYMSFSQEVDKADGKKNLALTLEGRKTWFRLACPNGGLVLNALRVTDTMAIFEARVFADAGDRNPLASFTATQRADKTKGEAYIRAAQDAALEEALKSAGFCLDISTLAYIAKGEGSAPQTGRTDDGKQPVESPKAPRSPVQTDTPQQEAKDNAPPPAGQTVQLPKPVTDIAPRPAPVGPPPHTAPASRPVPVEPQLRGTTTPQTAAQTHSGAAPVSENKDAAPVVDINTRQPAGQSGEASPTAPEAVPAANAAQEASPPPRRCPTPPT